MADELPQALALNDPSAKYACLITVDSEGYPASRIVTVRQLSTAGLAVSINVHSPKAIQLEANARYEINLFWPTVMVQYRLRGHHKISFDRATSDLWQSRGRSSKLADLYHATIRPQSALVDSRAMLLAEVQMLSARYPVSSEIPMPDSIRTVLFTPDFVEA
jgi:pyridoxamine 5'-phosphate oxidase